MKQLRQRGGFSLIEILVVLAIIGVLIGLSMAAVMRVRTAQMVRSSSDTVEKVQLALDTQYKAIIAQAAKDIDGQAQDAQAILDYFNRVGGDRDAAASLLAYCRIRQSFPQTFAEVQLPVTVVNGVSYQGFTLPNINAFFPVKSQFLPYANAATAPSTNLTEAQQSAALLYAAVAGTGAGGSTFASDDATASAQMDFQPSGAIKIHVYKDAWNQPIGFCRFGTNTELQGAPYVNTRATYQDPLDSSGKLFTWATTAATKAQANTIATYLFVTSPVDPANATNFVQQNLVTGAAQFSTNRRPVVYSTGYNRTYESLNMAPVKNTGYPSSDDILGYRLTQLGQKGTQ
jgi:prepilin-type N-terminal cleavage/methylation domain-containing protein